MKTLVLMSLYNRYVLHGNARYLLLNSVVTHDQQGIYANDPTRHSLDIGGLHMKTDTSCRRLQIVDYLRAHNDYILHDNRTTQKRTLKF